MKKNLKICLFIISILLSVNIVSAEECENLRMYAESNFDGKTDLYMNYGSVHLNYSLYNLKDNSGADFSAYCRNAGVSAGQKYTGQAFHCDHTVFDATSDEKMTKTYDAGIIEILKNGYSTRNPKTANISDDKVVYAATNVALRVYEMLWPLNTNGYNNGKNPPQNRAHEYYAKKWLEEKEIQSLFNDTVGKFGFTKDYITQHFNIIEVKSWTDTNGGDITNNVKEKAKELVIKGLKAAKNYLQNGAASLKGADQKPYKEKEPVSTDSNGNKVYKTSLTYTFEADKFKSSNAYIKISFGCNDCSKYGVNYKLFINDKEMGQDISNVNLVNYLKNGTGTIEFKIVFSATSNKYKCEELNYSLNLEWFDETISVEAYDMYSEGCVSNAECQHFYMLYATDKPTNKNLDNSIELCSLSCKEVETACKAGNKESCQIFKKNYGENCAECTTYISNAECSINDSNITITEGYDIDSANCGNISEDNNLNVLQCIIENKKDAAGNSYKAESLLSNDFCSVFCKEDYQFTLPGIKEVNSGRYFSLKANIEGSKKCYTSKIDEDNTFESQLETAREEVIKAYNEWSLYDNAINHRSSNLFDNPFEGDEIGGHYYDCDPCPNEGPCPRQSDRCSYCPGDKAEDYYSYKYTWSFEAYDPTSKNGAALTNGSNLSKGPNTTCFYKKGKIECTYENKGKTWCYSHESCGSENGKDITNYYTNNDLSEKARILNSKIEKYINIINQYNACSGVNTVSYNIELNSSTKNGWEMKYNYNPKIKFWYEESYMNTVLKDEFDTVGSIKMENLTQSLCTTDTNNAYKTCSNGWQSGINKNDIQRQFVCKKTSNGYKCDWYEIIISKAKYVKQEITVSGEYLTPTQFYTLYPNGSIVTAQAGEENNIENSSELTNKLPVGLGTTQGVYNYALKVEDLGEYYDKSKLGRIWGDENSVVVNVLEKTEEGNSCTKEGALTEAIKVGKKTISNGVYVCAYKVNCPDCPVECDPTCKNPSCLDGSCPVECENCIYTNNSINISYKPISPGNINPNDRELGINWKYNKDSISTALELKAYATTQEIEELGETIYDVNYEDTSSSDAEFAMHIKLDTKMINKIRAYNDKYENNEGYANNTLKCYDHVNSNDSKTYSNIYCYSTFIDELLYDNSTKNNIQIVGNRIIGTNAESSDTLRKKQTQLSGYWTTWSEANTNKWKITTEKGIAYYKQNYSEIGIGPSWK